MNLDITNLTEQQIKAVQYTQGPCMIAAGPGSGKTTVMAVKEAHLLNLGYGSNISDIATSEGLSNLSFIEGPNLLDKASELAIKSKANGIKVLTTGNQNQCDLLSILLSLRVSDEMTICGFVPTEYILPPFLEWGDCIIVVKQENGGKGRSHLVAHNIKPIKPVFKPTRLIREESK